MLRDYVLTKDNKNINQLKKAANSWIKAETINKLTYEIDWLGIPIIQLPEDMVLMQELIWKLKPDYVIECGIAHGGGLIFYASMLELIGKGKVIGIDIDIREYNRKAIEDHPLSHRITLIESDSSIVDLTLPSKKVIVILDSCHEKQHVLKELNKFKDLIGIGYYIIVSDTIIHEGCKWNPSDKHYRNNSPKEAVDEFLKLNQNFEIDKSFNKLYVSHMPDGYLKRIK